MMQLSAKDRTCFWHHFRDEKEVNAHKRFVTIGENRKPRIHKKYLGSGLHIRYISIYDIVDVFRKVVDVSCFGNISDLVISLFIVNLNTQYTYM